MKAKVSVILITYNESAKIGNCLRSLSWAEEVILVDSFSTDNTVEIASEFLNTRIFKHQWLGFVGSKELALQYTSNDWVLWIDADEEIGDALQEEIVKFLEMPHDFVAFDLPRKTFFLDKWVKHSGWYPGRIVRLFDKRECFFSKNILHEKILVPKRQKMGHIRNDLFHYSYDSLFQYFDKMNRYGMYAAQEMARKDKKFRAWQLIVNPLHAFIRCYFIEKGFLDGYNGLIISIGTAFYNFIKYANFYTLSKTGTEAKTKVYPLPKEISQLSQLA